MSESLLCLAMVFGSLGLKPSRNQVSVAYILERYHSKNLMIIATIESRLKSRALSRAGARGVMQIMPIAVKDVYRRDCIYQLPPQSEVDLYNPHHSVAIGACYFFYLKNVLFRGDLYRAVAAYNMGPSRASLPISRWPLETRSYVAKFFALKRAECKE